METQYKPTLWQRSRERGRRERGCEREAPEPILSVAQAGGGGAVRVGVSAPREETHNWAEGTGPGGNAGCRKRAVRSLVSRERQELGIPQVWVWVLALRLTSQSLHK